MYSKSVKEDGEMKVRALIQNNWKRFTLLAFLLAVLYFSWARISAPVGNQKVAFIPAKEECGSVGRMKYCVYRAQSGTNGDIVYHFHGRNLDERIWNDDTYWTSMVQSEWQRSGIKPPTVVALSYGAIWLLVPKGSQAESGLLEDVMANLPIIEEQTGAPKRRILLGESMGGLNVLIAGLNHPQRFAKIAALCPGVYTLSPFASFSEMTAALERTGADPKIGFGVWVMAKKYVSNEAEWKQVSPLSLIEKATNRYPAMYLSNGLYDAYGNFEGTSLLGKTAAERGVSVDWHPLYGGHCATDIVSLAQFLAS